MFPVLFHIGSFVVHSYGVVLMAAFLVALGRAYSVAKRQQDPEMPPDSVLDVGIWMIAAGVAGARLLFVVIGWKDYSHAPDFPGNIFKVWQGGLSFHGGLFGGIAAMVVYCLVKRLAILKMADLFTPSVMIAYAIGRIGCFLNGCCYGAPTNMPWGVRFFDDGTTHLTVPSQPTQIYSTVLATLFFVGLVYVERHRSYLGQVSCWFLLGTATERFIMEIWRAGTTSTVINVGPIHFLTDVQWLCIGLFALGLIGMAILRRFFPVRPAAALPSMPRPVEAAVR